MGRHENNGALTYDRCGVRVRCSYRPIPLSEHPNQCPHEAAVFYCRIPGSHFGAKRSCYARCTRHAMSQEQLQLLCLYRFTLEEFIVMEAMDG